MNAAGEAVAVWETSSIKAASRTPQGTWREADELSAEGGDPSDVDVVVDAAGNAVAIWTRYDNTTASTYTIEAATRSPGGQWGPALKLSELGNNAWRPRLAIDPSGNVLAAWSRWNDDGDTIIQVAEKKPGATWSEPEDISAKGAMANSAEVAVSAQRAVIVWQRSEIVEAAIRDVGGAWESPVKISDPGSREPSIGMDSAGNALAFWSSGPEIGLRHAEVASLPLEGDWTKPSTLSGRLAGEGARPRVAVDPMGRAIAVWTAWDGNVRLVEAISGDVGGHWETPVIISPPGSWSHRAQVAIDSAGNAAAVWRAADPLTTQAAVFDVTRPELTSTSIPSLVRAGRATSFTASPFDAWSPIDPVTWSFGDASTAIGSSVVHSFQEAGQFTVTATATDAAGHSTTASAQVNVTPALAISARLVPVRNRRARLALHCPGTAICHGNARLTHQARKKNGRKRTRLLGETEFLVPPETRMTVTIKLKTKRGPKLFSGRRRNGFHAQLTGDAVESRTVVLEPIVPRPNNRRPGRRSTGRH